MRLFTKMFLAASCSMVVATYALGQNRDIGSVDKQSTQEETEKMPEPEKFLADLLQIRQLIDLGIPLTPEENLQPGMRVRVKTGPMQGLEGQVLQRHGERKLLVSVNFIQRGASLELGDWELERIV